MAMLSVFAILYLFRQIFYFGGSKIRGPRSTTSLAVPVLLSIFLFLIYRTGLSYLETAFTRVHTSSMVSWSFDSALPSLESIAISFVVFLVLFYQARSKV